MIACQKDLDLSRILNSFASLGFTTLASLGFVTLASLDLFALAS